MGENITSLTATYSDSSYRLPLRAKYIDMKDGTGNVELRCTYQATVTTFPLGCKIALKSSGVTKEVTELHKVVKAYDFSLDSLASPSSQVSFNWIACIMEDLSDKTVSFGGELPINRGKSGTPSASLSTDRSKVELSAPVKVALVEVTYTEVYDLYEVTDIAVEGGVVLFESSLGTSASVDVPPTDAGALGKRKHVILEVWDYCTNTVLKDATVTITGPNSYNKTYTTTSTGRLDLGVLDPGKYKTSISAEGYLPSEQDLLANDGFEV